jgi:hypothetical protein
MKEAVTYQVVIGHKYYTVVTVPICDEDGYANPGYATYEEAATVRDRLNKELP